MMNRRGAGIALIAIAAFLWAVGVILHALDPNSMDPTIANALAVVALIGACIYLYLGEKNDPR